MSGAELQTFQVRPVPVTPEDVEKARAVVLRHASDEEIAAELVAILGLDAVPAVVEELPPAVFVDHGTRGTYLQGCRCCLCEDRMVRLGLIGGAE